MAIKPSDLLSGAKSTVNIEQAQALEIEIDDFLQKIYEGKTVEEMHSFVPTFSKAYVDISTGTINHVITQYLNQGWNVSRANNAHNPIHVDLIFKMPPAKVYRKL